MAPPAKRAKVANGAEPAEVSSFEAVRAVMRLKMLEEENEKLKKQLAAPQEGTEKISYSLKNHAKFLNSVQKASSIRCLDLSDMARTSKALIGQVPKWKSDAKLDAVVTTLLTTTNNVKELELGDAKWTSEEKYAKDLLKVVRHYKKNVTTLQCTIRPLVELVVSMKVKVPKRIWWGAGMGPMPTARELASTTLLRVNILETLGFMSNVSKLKIVFNGVDEERYGYRGEFNTEKFKKKLFSKVTELEITLTKEWLAFERKFLPERPDADAVLDLLTHWAPVITFLDMNALTKTAKEPAFLRHVPDLHALRSIALRAEFLAVTKTMASLESLGLLVEGPSDLLDFAIDFVVEDVVSQQSLQSLKRVEVRAAPGYDKLKLDKVLATLSDSCTHLEVVKVNDKDWCQ